MLTHAIDQYIALRRSVGFKLGEEAPMLRSYAQFASDRGDTHVRTHRALEWAALAPSPRQRGTRLRVVIAFARHALAEDAGHDLPPNGVFTRSGGRPRRSPYIYRVDEIQDLLNAAAKLGPAGSLRPRTYYTLFGLLACTGLRVSEALALRLDDFSDGRLIVRRTKFGKSRWVPLHPTSVAAVSDYIRRRPQVRPADDHVFVSTYGRPLRYKYVLQTFLTLVAGTIGAATGLRRPTIHALRHTFAVRALESSPNGRDHVGWHIRALSTYLGHSSVACTYWYLRATPHLMHDLADLCQPVVEGVAP
jgi:integrase